MKIKFGSVVTFKKGSWTVMRRNPTKADIGIVVDENIYGLPYVYFTPDKPDEYLSCFYNRELTVIGSDVKLARQVFKELEELT